MIAHLIKYNKVSDFFYSFKNEFSIVVDNNFNFCNFYYFSIIKSDYGYGSNFLSRFYKSHSSRKIRNQKGTGKARVGSRNSNIFVGSGYCFGFREISYNYYKKLFNRNIDNFFVIDLINNRSLFNCVDIFYLKFIFCLVHYENFYIYSNFLYYLLYLSKINKNILNFNFKNNINSLLLLLFKFSNFINILFI